MYSFFFFLMIRPPPKSTLFPYTPLFRSVLDPPQGLGLVLADEERAVAAAGEDDPAQQVHLGLVDHSGADVAGAAGRAFAAEDAAFDLGERPGLERGGGGVGPFGGTGKEKAGTPARP